jgi:hypothetical protein
MRIGTLILALVAAGNPAAAAKGDRYLVHCDGGGKMFLTRKPADSIGIENPQKLIALAAQHELMVVTSGDVVTEIETTDMHTALGTPMKLVHVQTANSDGWIWDGYIVRLPASCAEVK